MEITLLCNAGLSILHQGETLLIDLPNLPGAPFYALPELTWDAIRKDIPPFDNVCGFFFTHDHPDHYDAVKLQAYKEKHTQIPVFLPDCVNAPVGTIQMGHYKIEYFAFDHAPIENAPAHVVAVIHAGEQMIYISGDAALDCPKHRNVLGGRNMDLAVWTSMYLSRQETRELLNEVAEQNLIYHMPEKPDDFGLWKKCDKNIDRYGREMRKIIVPETYPATIHI